MYETFYQQCFDEPLDYVRHDTDARLDDSLRLMVMCDGVEMLGWWWTFVECSARKRGHYYDVSDDMGWRALALDLSTCGSPVDVGKAQAVVEALMTHGLVDREAYGHGRVMNERVCREANNFAEAKASKMLGAWKTAQKQQSK